MLLEKLPYIVYLIALIVLILPSFVIKNNKIGIFIKNLSIWLILLFVILLIYKKFIIY